jgi:hypothetical protein
MPNCCQFCLRGIRDTNLRRVCGSCRKTERNACLFCGLPFQGSHTCALKVPECVHCYKPFWLHKLALPLSAAPGGATAEHRKGLCGKCKSQGFILCTKSGCASVAENPGKHVYCNAHHPLPASSLWRKGIVPTGGPPFLSTWSWRSWGVELECFQERDTTVPESWRPPTGWAKGTDGSISAKTPTAEFRSPPFYGDRGLVQMVKDIWSIRRAGWSGVNLSTGTHIHLDMSGTDEEDYRAIHKFARAFEDQIFELVSPSRRTSSYAKRLGTRINLRDRYRWANFCALREFGTLEIRLHQGTMNPIRVKMWACLMLKFIETGIRIGRQRGLPKKGLFDVLNLTPRERIYWTARRNRFIRDQQERERRAQTATAQAVATSTPQATPVGG